MVCAPVPCCTIPCHAPKLLEAPGTFLAWEGHCWSVSTSGQLAFTRTSKTAGSQQSRKLDQTAFFSEGYYVLSLDPSTCKTEHAVEGVAGLAPSQARTPLKVLLGREVAFSFAGSCWDFRATAVSRRGRVHVQEVQYITLIFTSLQVVRPTPVLAMQDCCWSAPACWTQKVYHSRSTNSTWWWDDW